MQYKLATSVSDALGFLIETQGKGRIIAGGTDAVIDLQEGKISACTLVDICQIPELKEIRLENGNLIIGSAVTLTNIAKSDLIKKHLPSLAQAAARVGSRQIGNTATLAGNVITAQPAADGAMALASLNPTFTVVSENGSRTMKMEEMYAGFGKSSIDSSREIVTYITVPVLSDNEASEFVRLELRKALALPMLNSSVYAKIQDKKFVDVRIAIGPVGVGPTRAKQAEAWLAGKDVNEANIKEASKMALLDSNPRSNPLRGTREYRLEVIPVLIKRGLMAVAKQLSC